MSSEKDRGYLIDILQNLWAYSKTYTKYFFWCFYEKPRKTSGHNILD